ncbi:MAG: hypothetical protein ACRDP6_29150 [Actinoallomurus sp.]
MTEPDHGDHGGGLSNRHVRIAGIAGGAVLIVGLAVAVGTAGGSRPAAHQTKTPAPPTSAPPLAVASTPPPLASSAPSTPARPVVRWHGTVTVSGPDAHKDLDSNPPQTFPQDADLNGDWLTTALKADSDGVQFALSSTPSPGFPACREAVATNGVDHLEQVRNGDVLCLLTSQGRVARLRTLEATQTSGSPVLKFDVTVWDPPTRAG